MTNRNKDKRLAYELVYYHTHKEQNKDKRRVYRESHKEQRKAYQKIYILTHKEQKRAYNQTHKERDKAYRQKYNLEHPGWRSAQRRKSRQRAKLTVLSYYGNGKLQCVCCGEANPVFLTLDHINGLQGQPRIRGNAFYGRLCREGFPQGLQTLCFNCNCGKGLVGQCPHKQVLPTSQIQESPNLH